MSHGMCYNATENACAFMRLECRKLSYLIDGSVAPFPTLYRLRILRGDAADAYMALLDLVRHLVLAADGG